MIYSYNISKQSLAQGDAVVYAIDTVKTGTTVTHTPGTSLFTFNEAGYYYITATASGAATATGTDPVSLALYNGSTEIVGATASAVSDTAVNLTINAIIPVRPSCCMIDNTVNLSVVNTGVETTYTNVTITIIKLS